MPFRYLTSSGSLTSSSVVRITYNNLTHTSYNGKSIKSAVYTFSHFITPTDNIPISLQVYNNPFIGFWYHAKQLQVSLQFFYDSQQKDPVEFNDKVAQSYLVLGSLNWGIVNNDRESARLISNGISVNLAGSTITFHKDGWLHADQENEGIKWLDPNTGKIRTDNWDYAVEGTYVGAGVVEFKTSNPILEFASSANNAWAIINTNIPETTTINSKITKTVTETIHYQYKDGTKAHDDVVKTETVPQTGYFDAKTGKTVWLDWSQVPVNFPSVTSPTISGYTPSKTVVGPDQTTADTNLDKTVIYTPDVQKLEVKYIDDTTGATLRDDQLQDISGTKTSYATTDQINNFEKQHYLLVSDSTLGKTLTFDNDSTKNQYYEVHFKHDTQPTTQTATVTRTINYVDQNKQQLSKPVTEQTTLTGTGTIDLVTGQLVKPLTWAGETTLNGQKSPVINGYHLVGVDRDSKDNQNVDPVTVNHETDSYNVYVTYEPNGKIIPVDQNNQPIPNVDQPQYPTDPQDPTKVTPNEKVPSIPGYTPATPTVTPSDPGKDTPVLYTQSQAAEVVYVDQDDNNAQLATSGTLTGPSGSVINYDKQNQAEITKLENQGYKLINNGFPADAVYDTDSTKTQRFVVVMGHDTTTVTPTTPGTPGQPINPNDPNGPKYPAGTDKAGLTATSTQTVHYVGAGDQTPKDNVTTLNFTRTKTIDKVTGKVVDSTDWTPSTQNFQVIGTPQIKGYTPDYQYVGGDAVGPNSTKNYTVTYTKDTTPTVNDQHAQVRYLDQDNGNSEIAGTNSGDLTGKPGTAINYSTADTLTKLTKQGYVLVNNGFDYGGQVEYFDNNDSTNQVFIVTLKHGTQDITPSTPGDPGQPINPSDPQSPKYPSGTDKQSLIAHGTQTVHYVGAGDQTPKDSVTTVDFGHDLVLDKVTGQIVQDNGWKPLTQNYQVIDTPVIDGYTPDHQYVGGGTVSVENPNRVYTVTYTKNGQGSQPSQGSQSQGSQTSEGSQGSQPSQGSQSQGSQTSEGSQGSQPSQGSQSQGSQTSEGSQGSQPSQGSQSQGSQTSEGSQGSQPSQGSQSQGSQPSEGSQGSQPSQGSQSQGSQPGEGSQGSQPSQGSQSQGSQTSEGSQGSQPSQGSQSQGSQTSEGSQGSQPSQGSQSQGSQTSEGSQGSQPSQGSQSQGSQTSEGSQGSQPSQGSQSQGSQPSEGSQGSQPSQGSQSQGSQPSEGSQGSQPSQGLQSQGSQPSEGSQGSQPSQGSQSQGSQTSEGSQGSQPSQGSQSQGSQPSEGSQGSQPSQGSQSQGSQTSEGSQGSQPSQGSQSQGSQGSENQGSQSSQTPATDTEKVVIKYVDPDGNPITTDTVTGKGGQPINYDQTKTITELENKGYDVTTITNPTTGQNFDNNPSVDQTYTVTVKHGTAQLGPNDPHESGTPINPNDPNSPKWPAKDIYSKDYTYTVHFVGPNGETLTGDNVQTSTWTRTVTVDKVTGKVISGTDWTPSQKKYSDVQVPVVDGYYTTQKTITGQPTVQKNISTTVSYQKLGQIVPVDQNGKQIGTGQTYQNDPNDPTKVKTNQTVPSVDGYTPTTSTVTPTTPGEDTTVTYTKNTTGDTGSTTSNGNTANTGQNSNGGQSTSGTANGSSTTNGGQNSGTTSPNYNAEQGTNNGITNGNGTYSGNTAGNGQLNTGTGITGQTGNGGGYAGTITNGLQGQVVSAVSGTSNAASNGGNTITLPQTGNDTDTSAILAAAGIELAGALGLAGLAAKKKREN
nr:LPXTG cell wall anchor domain-containing protein [Limosilactobacillus kribbianus]